MEYSLIRTIDGSIFYSKVDAFSFLPKEVKREKFEFDYSKIPSGSYNLVLTIKGANNLPISFVSKEINISTFYNEEIKFSIPPYLKIFYVNNARNKVSFELSTGNTGKNIIKDSDFLVNFELEKNSSKTLNKNLLIVYSISSAYSTKEKVLTEKNITMTSNKKNFSNSFSFNKSGTYNLFVSIFDEKHNLLSKRSVKTVINGEGGHIIDLKNSKDTYLLNETAHLTINYVGSADGFSTTKNAFLKVEFFKNNSKLISEVKTIKNLTYSPKTIDFYIKIPENLTKYSINVSLGKGFEIFDSVSYNFTKLTAKYFINEKGQVYDQSLNLCFDNNFCSKNEKSLGNCLDCMILPKTISNKTISNSIPINEDNEVQNFYLKPVVIVFLLITLSLLIIVYLRYKK